MTAATDLLVAPPEPDDSVTGGYGLPTDIFNYLSPSAWVDNVIAKVTGYDIFAHVTEVFTGEWDSLYKFGDALGNLAQSLQQIGIDVQTGIDRLDGQWGGNAADSAHAYFTQLSTALSSQQNALYAAQDSYHRAARGAYELADQIGNLLQTAIDKAILIGIAVSLGTATSETIVGGVVGYTLAGYQALSLLNTVNKAATIANTAGTVIFGLMGGAEDFFSQVGHPADGLIPPAPYSPPGA
jgi:uncharacterized protein YukE